MLAHRAGNLRDSLRDDRKLHRIHLTAGFGPDHERDDLGQVGLQDNGR